MAVLLLAPPTDLVRAQLAAEVERQTGRKLEIRSAGVSLLSGLGVSLEGVVLSAPPAMGGAPLLKADRVDVSVAILPFILREVKVERLTLQRPVIDLRVDATGRRSWEFAGGDASRPLLRYAQGPRTNDAARLPPELRDFARNGSAPGAGAAGSAIRLEGLSLRDVRISDGTVRYSDARSGQQREVKGIDATLAMPRFGGPLEVVGHAALGVDRLAVNVRVEPFSDLIAEKPVKVSLKLDGKPVALSYRGSLTMAGAGPALAGNIDLKSASAVDLARLIELPLPGLDRLGAVGLAGDIKAGPGSYELTSGNVTLGASRATGSVAVDVSAARPAVKANLRFARLDLDSLLAAGPTAAAAAGATPGRFAVPPVADGPQPAAPGASAGSAPTSIEDLLRPSQSGPQVRGWRSRPSNQWDVEAIDAGALRLFDIDGRFHIADLTWGGIAMRDVQAAAELNGGHLRASITEGEVAGGKMRGLASLDARKPALVVGANLSGDGVAVGLLLKAAGIDLMTGKGRAIVTLSARGVSERELVSSLGGRMEVSVANGELVGWNADAIIAGLGRGEVPSLRRSPEARTAFSRLSGTFRIADGVARTTDLALESAAVTASGAGLVNLVDRNLDLKLKPRLATGGIEIPLRVAGAWDNPSLVPDVAGALNSPAAQEAVRQLGRGDVDGALRSVLGNGPKAEQKIDKAKDFLRQFLKQ